MGLYRIWGMFFKSFPCPIELLLSGCSPGGLSSAFSFPAFLGAVKLVCLLWCFSCIMELPAFFQLLPTKVFIIFSNALMHGVLHSLFQTNSALSGRALHLHGLSFSLSGTPVLLLQSWGWDHFSPGTISFWGHTRQEVAIPDLFSCPPTWDLHPTSKLQLSEAIGVSVFLASHS